MNLYKSGMTQSRQHQRTKLKNKENNEEMVSRNICEIAQQSKSD